MTPTAFDVPLYVATVGAGIVLIGLARWATRRGSRWDALVALRVGSVLFTEVLGAFLIGYGLGAILAVQMGPSAAGPGGPPRPPIPVGGRLRGFGGFQPFDPDNLPTTLGGALALVAVLIRIDIRDLLTPAKTKDPLAGYVGWDARVIAPIRAGGFGEIALHYPDGNIRSVAATSDVDIPEGARAVVVGVRDLNLVVAPEPGTPPA